MIFPEVVCVKVPDLLTVRVRFAVPVKEDVFEGVSVLLDVCDLFCVIVLVPVWLGV